MCVRACVYLVDLVFLLDAFAFFSLSQFDSMYSIEKIPMNQKERRKSGAGLGRECARWIEKLCIPFRLSLRAMSFDLCFYLFCVFYI